jgi:hypothetical protein
MHLPAGPHRLIPSPPRGLFFQVSVGDCSLIEHPAKSLLGTVEHGMVLAPVSGLFEQRSNAVQFALYLEFSDFIASVLHFQKFLNRSGASSV